jgi:alpha-ketoglutarate-dependent sulfate ester dioxygenase
VTSSATLSLTPLSDTVGAEVHDVGPEQLANDVATAEAVREALEAHGVLVFRELHLDPEAQVAFCRHLGDVDCSASHHPVPGIFRITLDPTKNAAAEYLHATFHWHIDGCTPEGDECPQMATFLSAQAVADRGGETEFASTYAAYDDLTEGEQERLLSLQVVYSLEASQRKVHPEPTEQQLAQWRGRRTSQFPLVWTHRDGRRSLVVGASADHVVGMDPDESRALLDDLLVRATRPARVYRHSWSVGDSVIWDNRGVLHRAAPYDPGSAREMLRTTVLGDEPIQ